MCLFYLKPHLQFRNVSWSRQTFPSSQAERESSVGKSATSGAALTSSCGCAASTNCNSSPCLEFQGGQLVPHQCTTELVTYTQGTFGWTNLGKWSEDRKPDHKQLVIHSVFRLLSWCTSFLYPRKISHHQKSICHVLKQDASPHAQDGYPLSFNINFSFLGNKSSHYPPEALTVFSFIAFRSPSRLQSK